MDKRRICGQLAGRRHGIKKGGSDLFQGSEIRDPQNLYDQLTRRKRSSVSDKFRGLEEIGVDRGKESGFSPPIR